MDILSFTNYKSVKSTGVGIWMGALIAISKSPCINQSNLVQGQYANPVPSITNLLFLNDNLHAHPVLSFTDL
jgi:hypothetical protein